MSSGGSRLGVDVGGTFTDFVLITAEDEIKLHKRLSTPRDPSIGVMQGLQEMSDRFGVAPADLAALVHGTTVVSNTLIERKGDVTGLITTAGFRDVLEMGREIRYDIYDLLIETPEPLAPRDLRLEINERTLADGAIRTVPDGDEVRRLAEHLLELGAKSVAVCLINSPRNPANERAVGRILREEYPQLHASLSCEVAPEIREYERTSTTVANAYVHPLVDRYLDHLSTRLGELGFRGSLYVMLSHGGIGTVEFVRRGPIHIVESGPAAGVQATSFLSRLIGNDRVISFDMGGTTAKLCVIDKGSPDYTSNAEVARVHRFKKGSGLPLKVPKIELIEIGAGGGSIAWLDDLGLLRIGPESAGAEPGPACYGLGGARPTVTDANLVLGYLNPSNFLGGAMRLDVHAAKQAIERDICSRSGVSVVDAAAGIVGLANENMAAAARLHVAERGRDPQLYSLFAFGGAGPVHAYGLARALRLGSVICPAAAGNLSALGFLVAPVVMSTVRTYVAPLEALDWSHVTSLVGEMYAEGDALMAGVGIEARAVNRRIACDMRYVGQGYEVPVELDEADFSARDASRLRSKFEDAYYALFGMRLPEVRVETFNWRVSSHGPVPELALSHAFPGEAKAPRTAITAERPVFLPAQREFASVPVYDRYGLTAGMAMQGPVIVEERESTLVVNGPGTLTLDEHGNLHVRLAYQ